MAKKKPTLDVLGQLILEKRGEQGIRGAAKEIGVSHATLSRVENGQLPDLENFKLICAWLEVDPNDLLGFSSSKEKKTKNNKIPSLASVHFKKKKTTSPDTAKSLAEMILRAQQALRAHEQ